MKTATKRTQRDYSFAFKLAVVGQIENGEMSIVGKMHIDGIFEGNITSLDSISIGKRGEVHGIIRAHQVNVCRPVAGRNPLR